jgi:hypothetical protein
MHKPDLSLHALLPHFDQALDSSQPVPTLVPICGGHLNLWDKSARYV